jgi:hypothetical protein
MINLKKWIISYFRRKTRERYDEKVKQYLAEKHNRVIFIEKNGSAYRWKRVQSGILFWKRYKMKKVPIEG